MRAPVADQQILAGAAGTLTWQYLDADGEPADPGTVTVGATRADGTVLLAAGTATTADGTKRTVALTSAQTAALNLLTATWTRTTDSTTHTTRAEIVGGYYFSLAKARSSDPVLGDTQKYPDTDLLGYRHEIEDEFERITEVAFVPRFRRTALDGTGSRTLLLPTSLPRRVTAVAELADDGTPTAWSAGDLAGIRFDESGEITSTGRSFPCGRENVVVAWEHGHDRPPPDVLQAALLRLRHRAIRPKTAIPDRAQTFQLEGGTVYRLDQADRESTGIPDVDAVLDRWSMAIPGIA